MLNAPYVTRANHGAYPAGTSCLASRIEGVLFLEFEDGVRLNLGQGWYAEGLEPRASSNVTVWDIMYAEIVREIDEEVLGDLQRSCEARQG